MRSRTPMSAWDGFIFGFIVVNVVLMLLLRHWGDALDGAIIATLYLLWSRAQRRAEFLERLIDPRLRIRTTR